MHHPKTLTTPRKCALDLTRIIPLADRSIELGWEGLETCYLLDGLLDCTVEMAQAALGMKEESWNRKAFERVQR